MKTVKFKVIHRLLLLGLLNKGSEKGGSLSQMHKMYKILDKIDFKEEEQKKINLRQVDNQMHWWKTEGGIEGAQEIDVDKEIQFSDDEIDVLKEIYRQADEAKQFSLQGLTPIMEIAEQIGYEMK